MKVTMGVELELGVEDAQGRPLNVLNALDGGIELGRPFHAVTGELGRPMAEFVTPICCSQQEARHTLWQCAESLPKGSRRIHKTRPFGPSVQLAEFKYKPRYPVVRRGLRREHPCGSFTLHAVAPNCSTQFQIYVGDVSSRAGMFLRNFLDNIATYADLRVRQRYDISDAKQHLMIWMNWSIPERVPGYRWFRSAEEMHAFVHKIPQLVTQAEDGRWIVAEGIPSKIGNPLSEGTIWWLARPRGVYQTIEWRSFPALAIDQAAELAGLIFQMMEEFWEYVEKNPHRDWCTPGDAVDLYRQLSKRYYFVPEAPLSQTQWLTYFVQ